MKLTNEELKFITDWEKHRANKTKYILFRTFIYGAIYFIGDSILTTNGFYFNSESKDFDIKNQLLKTGVWTAFWLLFWIWKYYSSEKKYKTLIEKKSSETSP